MAMDLTGHQYGKWTVIGPRQVKVTEFSKTPHWLCRCECGGEHWVSLGNLRAGLSRGCTSCQRSALRKPRTRIYAYWRKLRSQGVLCTEWCDSHEQFAEEVGERKRWHVLVSDDADGILRPGRCRWVHSAVTRRDENSINSAARRLGISHQAIRSRIQEGWTYEEATSLPRGAATGRIRRNRKTPGPSKKSLLREDEALSAIESYITSHGYPPTYRELAEAIGLSLGGARNAVHRLSRKGRLQVARGARAMRVCRDFQELRA